MSESDDVDAFIDVEMHSIDIDPFSSQRKSSTRPTAIKDTRNMSSLIGYWSYLVEYISAPDTNTDAKEAQK